MKNGKQPIHPSICLVIPYFGNWPVYFELFLYTVAKQKNFNVLLFTDIPYNKALPSNVEMIPFSMEDFVEPTTG